MGGRQDGDTAKPGHRQESGRLAIHDEHFFPTGSLQQGATVEPEQSSPLNHDPFSRCWKGFEDGDHGSKRAIGRSHHGIAQRVGHWHEVCAGSQNHVSGVAAVQSRSVRHASVAVFEKPFAFLR